MTISMTLKNTIKKIPVIGACAQKVWRRLNPPQPPRSEPKQEPFHRITLESTTESAEKEMLKLQNVLNYTKRRGVVYSATNFSAGYHSIKIGDVRLAGQRDPRFRLDKVPISFAGKTVLDIGSNQGGMLHEVAGEIKWGVGVDYDSRMVNAANRIAAHTHARHIHFYVLDIEKEPLGLIEDFLPESKVDIVFLLSVCMWIKNWREVIAYAAGISHAMLFETNGTDDQQMDQERELRSIYKNVRQLTEQSTDDVMQKKRKLFFCTGEDMA